jgi:ribosomal protein L10
MTDELKRRLDGVGDALLVDIVGLDAIKNSTLRRRLRQQNIHLMVVKNSLARRATEGTPLAPAFDSAEGTLAILWGGEDVVSLAKEVARISGEKGFEGFEARGGAMDGAPLSPEDVLRVSKWPNRAEQLSLLVGQILSPGARLASQINGPGAKLASQIKKKGDAGEDAS